MCNGWRGQDSASHEMLLQSLGVEGSHRGQSCGILPFPLQQVGKAKKWAGQLTVNGRSEVVALWLVRLCVPSATSQDEQTPGSSKD